MEEEGPGYALGHLGDEGGARHGGLSKRVTFGILVVVVGSLDGVVVVVRVVEGLKAEIKVPVDLEMALVEIPILIMKKTNYKLKPLVSLLCVSVYEYVVRAHGAVHGM